MAQTFAQLYGQVLGDDFDSSKYLTDAKQAINDAIDDIARQASVPLLEGAWTVPIVAGTATYTLPADDVRLLSAFDAELHQSLSESDQETLDVSSPASGRPTTFAQYGGSVTFYPTPNRAYSVQVRYLRDPASITADGADITTVMPDSYAFAVVAFARARLFAREDDPQLSAFWRSEYERDLGRIKGDLGRRSRGRVRQVPGPYRQRLAPRFLRP
jgi:hypothetical protein